MTNKSLEDQYNDSVKARFKKFDTGLDKLFNVVGKAMVSTTRGLQDKNKNYASRRLSNLTNFKPNKTKGSTSITFGSNASNEGIRYGLIQEFGRKKGKGISKEGQEQLVKWLKTKIILGHVPKPTLRRKSGRIRLSTAQRRENLYKGIAYLISRKQKRDGTTGKFYYQKGFLAGNELFEKQIINLIIEVFL